MKKFNKKGFTIVELVIVIAVIAILAGVLIPTFSGMVKKAQESAALQNARNKYTEYVGMHDYTNGDPAQNLVIELGKGDKVEDLQYVIVVDAKMVDKVYEGKNKELAKADAKYDEDTPAYFLCDECNAGDDDGTICDDCGKCVEHVDGNDEDTICDIEGCGKCKEHDWTENPATGVCEVCYEECKDAKHNVDATCPTCDITKQ